MPKARDRSGGGYPVPLQPAPVSDPALTRFFKRFGAYLRRQTLNRLPRLEQPYRHQYDITDADFLIEWVHATLTKLIKLFVAEQKIDQEIDFTIFRESRQGITGSPEAKKKRFKRES